MINKNMKSMSLIDLFQLRASENGDSLAYTFLKNGEDETDTLTYSEIDKRSRAISVLLQEKFTFGDRALLMYPAGLDFIIGFMACIYAGIIAVPVYPANSSRAKQQLPKLSSIADCAKSEIILTNNNFINLLPSLLSDCPILSKANIINTTTIDLSMADQWTMPSVSEDSLALLQFTSGSTASPKGVMISHGNVMNNLKFIHKCEGHNEDSISVSWLPAYHDMGLIEGILAPSYGAYPAYLMSPQAFIQQPYRWLKAITKYKASHSGGPNFSYQYCSKAISKQQREQLDLSSWRVAYNGAEPVRLQSMKKFNDVFKNYGFNFNAFHPVYGLAESTALASSRVSNSDSKKIVTLEKNIKSNVDFQHELVSCGEIDDNTIIKIVDAETLRQCQEGDEGEIWLKGPSVAQGYWNNTEQTQRYFEAYTADTHEGPFLRTGDLGIMHENELFVSGRIKDMIIIRGRKIYPQDLEFSIAQNHPLIRNNGVAAFSIEANSSEYLAIMAEVNVPRVGKIYSESQQSIIEHPYSLKELTQDLIECVALHHETQVACALLVKPGVVSKTSSGKVQRFACRENYLSGNLQPLYSWETESIQRINNSVII